MMLICQQHYVAQIQCHHLHRIVKQLLNYFVVRMHVKHWVIVYLLSIVATIAATSNDCTQCIIC